MKLIDQSIRNYHSVTVVMALLVVVGIICFNTLPRQLTPTVDKPLIEVRTEYLGLSPNEVERNITRRLEEQLESEHNDPLQQVKVKQALSDLQDKKEAADSNIGYVNRMINEYCDQIVEYLIQNRLYFDIN